MNGKINRVFKKDDTIIVLKKKNEEELILDLAMFTILVNKTCSIMVIDYNEHYILQTNKWHKNILNTNYSNPLLAIISKEKVLIHKSTTEDEINTLISEVSKNEKEKLIKDVKSTIDEKIIYNIVPCKDFCKVFNYGEDLTSKNYIKITF